MKIAYLCADFGIPVFGFKGASIHVREMVAAFRKVGHHVCVISPALNAGKQKGGGQSNGARGAVPSPAMPESRAIVQPEELGTIEFPETIQYFSVTPRPFQLQVFKQLETLDKFLESRTHVRQEVRSMLYNTTLFEEATPLFEEFRPDFVYERYSILTFAGIRLARHFGIPHILEVNSPLVYERDKVSGLEMRELAMKFEHRIYRESDFIFVVSRELQKYVIDCGVPEHRVSVLPNAVNPNRFTQVDEAKVHEIRQPFSGKRLIGFVGSLKPWHGTETLLQAFERLHIENPQTHLLIVGDGPQRDALEQFTERAGLGQAITFAGKIPHSEIPAYIAAMDITVAPYIPSENFYFSPIKIFEYMAMGKPVIAGKIGQVAEIVQDGKNGLLFEPGNISELTRALVRLCQDPALGQALGACGKAWVLRERTWDRNAEQVLQKAQQLIQENQVIV